MEQVLLLKLASEIHLKSDFVRKEFEEALQQNMRNALKNNKIEIKQFVKKRGKIILNTNNNKKAIMILKKVFGIHSIAETNYVKAKEISDVQQNVLKYVKPILKKKDSFALRVNRIGSQKFSSTDIAIQCGKAIQQSIDVSVNLDNPKKEIFIELDEDDLFLFSKIEECARGIPVGVEGKIGLLMEGNASEFLAGKLMLKRGCEIIPLVQKNKAKCVEILKKLKEYNAYVEFKPLFISLDKLRFNFDALIVSYDKTTKQNLDSLIELQKKYNIAVFAPLLGLSKELLKELK
ncbi:MAG: THUMP domain-containing protein [archaeon]|nr:THUMP domain-containing protein [archaeon]